MIAIPFDLFVANVTQPPIASSVAFTLASQSAQGGAGLMGNGIISTVVSLMEASGSSLAVSAKVLPGGVVGAAYSEAISAQGGSAPYTFAVAAGSLPLGLSLNSSTGVISGTPTTVETSDFTIQAADSNAAVGSTDFEIGVAAPVSAGAAAYGWVA